MINGPRRSRIDWNPTEIEASKVRKWTLREAAVAARPPAQVVVGRVLRRGRAPRADDVAAVVAVDRARGVVAAAAPERRAADRARRREFEREEVAEAALVAPLDLARQNRQRRVRVRRGPRALVDDLRRAPSFFREKAAADAGLRRTGATISATRSASSRSWRWPNRSWATRPMQTRASR